MRMWIDTEFNGFHGELISIALVAEDGNEFYEILQFNEAIDPWVMKNVIPVVNSHEKTGDRFSVRFPRSPKVRETIRFGLQEWLALYPEGVHIVADWPEDIAHFCCLLLTETPGERIDTPPLTMEIIRIDTVSKVPHNALEDARAMRAYFLENGL